MNPPQGSGGRSDDRARKPRSSKGGKRRPKRGTPKAARDASGGDRAPRGKGDRDRSRGEAGGDRKGSRSGGGRRDGSSRPARTPKHGVPPLPTDLMKTEFEAFDLPPRLLAAIARVGYETPSPIQEQLIPLALEEKNVVGRSHTGSGKTCAFLTPLIALLDEAEDEAFIQKAQPRGPVRILVVVPTRELAIQVAGEAEKLTHFLPIRTACVYGGVRINAQIEQLKTASIAVGTPGRLLDHIGRRTLDLRGVDVVVLDEVDRMYDLGFREDVDRILAASRARSQTLLMSATLNEDVERLIDKHIGEHERVLIESRSLTVDEVEQKFYFVDPRRKQDLLLALLQDELDVERGIVFVRTKFNTDRLAHRLRKEGVQCREIHSGRRQSERESILRDFRAGKFPLLVATDVAARGLDISGITHVINFDIPNVAEDYVHRVGRTARMGQKGHAVSFVTTDDGPLLTEIEKLINRQIEQESYPGFELETVRDRLQKQADAKPERPKGLPSWTNPVRRRRR